MTEPQQAAYWRDKARKHEDRVKALGITPEQLAALRAKATKHDELERELMDEKDRKIADARTEADAAARATYLPQLVAAEFRAAAAGRIDASKLDTILEPLDLNKFVGPDNAVDRDKLAAFVDGIADGIAPPVTGKSAGPPAHGQGVRTGGDSGAHSVASGRELYQKRHARKTA